MSNLMISFLAFPVELVLLISKSSHFEAPAFKSLLIIWIVGSELGTVNLVNLFLLCCSVWFIYSVSGG